MRLAVPDLSNTLRAMSSRNYRLFFSGQLVSLIGTWITQIATGWLVYRLTHDTLMLGVVTCCGQLPGLFLAPFAGVWVDRINIRRVLIVTQISFTLVSTALALLTLTNAITIPAIIVLYVLHGLITSVDIPARQAFVYQLIDRREDLPNAIALNSTMFNAARLLGPSIAGVLIAAFGEGLCYSIDAASYLAVIAALLLMRLTPRKIDKVRKNFLVELKEGVRYAMGFIPIRALLTNLALVTLSGVQYAVLMPAFSRDVLHGDSRTLGFLMAASGGGAVCGGLMLASRRNVRGLGRIIWTASSGLGVVLILFGFSRSLWISVPLLALVGFCMITQTAATNTLLQSVSDDGKRGRVMSLFGMSFQGMMPIGSLVAGYLAKPRHLGPGHTVVAAGCVCLFAAFLFARQLPSIRAAARPILEQRGLIPPWPRQSPRPAGG